MGVDFRLSYTSGLSRLLFARFSPVAFLKAGAQCAPHRDQFKRFGSQVTQFLMS